MSLKLPRVVFDSNVFIQYLLNPAGLAGRCMRTVEDKKAELFVSKEILYELVSVILRPNVFSRLQGMTEPGIDAFVEHVTSISSLIDPVPKKFTLQRDPKDEMVINLAVCSNANYIVSRDNDLLDLMTGYTDECKDFRRRFRGLKVVQPSEFLTIIEEASNS